MDRQHRRLVARAKAELGQRLAHAGELRPDHHLVVRHLGVVEVEDVLHLGRLEAAHGLQVDDRARPARRSAAGCPRAAPSRAHRGDDRVAAVDRGQEDADQVPQTGLLDRLAVDRSAGLHDHLDREPPRRLLQLGHRRATSWQHAGGQRDDGADADDRHRNTDRADLEEPHGLEPASAICPATTRLVEVPISVAMPPSSAANDNGINSLLTDTCRRSRPGRDLRDQHRHDRGVVEER